MLRLLFAHFRAILRLVIGLTVLGLLVLSWFFPLLVRPFSAYQADKLLLRQLGVWSRLTLKIMGIKVVSEGPVPQAPYLLASNHLSYLDVFVLWSKVDGFFLGKSELAKWPALGPLITAAGTVFINRSKRSGVVEAIEGVTDKILLGNGVIFFPEGSSSSGGEIRQFKSNLFQVAAHSNLEVNVAVIHYTTNNKSYRAEKDLAWWGDMSFVSHFYKLLTFDSKVAHVRFLDERVSHGDRKQMAQCAEQLAKEAFTPMHAYSDIEKGSDVSFIA
jgi:1-acyl-sn-glycerol-3-phosphate acyltransferase